MLFQNEFKKIYYAENNNKFIVELNSRDKSEKFYNLQNKYDFLFSDESIIKSDNFNFSFKNIFFKIANKEIDQRIFEDMIFALRNQKYYEINEDVKVKYSPNYKAFSLLYIIKFESEMAAKLLFGLIGFISDFSLLNIPIKLELNHKKKLVAVKTDHLFGYHDYKKGINNDASQYKNILFQKSKLINTNIAELVTLIFYSCGLYHSNSYKTGILSQRNIQLLENQSLSFIRNYFIKNEIGFSRSDSFERYMSFNILPKRLETIKKLREI